MAKLPDYTELGGAPNLNSGRPIANIDQSGIAKGVSALGQGIGNLGEGVAVYARAQDDFDLAKRVSAFETQRVGLDSSFDQDQEYATREKRYADELTKLRGTVLDGASPRVAEQFNVKVDPVAARAVERQKDIGFKLQTDAKLADVHTIGNDTIEAATKTDDRDARMRMIQTYVGTRDQPGLIDNLVTQGHMTRTQAIAVKEQWAQKFAMSDGVARAETDPEGVVNDLRAKPGSMTETANRVIQVESSGNPNARAKTTSAFGAAQFLATSKSDQTWLGLVKEFRPDLAEGKSVAEIDDMRADPNLSREMLGKLLEKNKSILSRNGIEPAPAALYLTHFLGPKSAMAVLQADPKRPVADVLSEAVGPAFAKQMIEANMSVLAGRQAGSVAQWAAARMGGADRGSVYNILTQPQRDQLLNHAEGVLHKQRVDDFADFQGRVKDTEAEAGVTGTVEKPIGQWEFISRLGFAEGKKAFERHDANVQLGRDAATLANLDPEERQSLFTKYTPQPGPGFADAEKRREILISADKHIQKEKADDPAKFAVSRLPAVAAAYNQFQTVLGKPGSSPDEQQKAARTYADTLLMEQGRIGIAPADRRIVSNEYVDNLVSSFGNQPAAGGPSNIAQKIEEQAKLWGDHWPDVYRDIIAKKPGPVVEVIGSGIKPDAARLLTDLQPLSPKQILRDESEERWKPIETAVRDVLKPFAQSTLGHDGRSRTLEVFQGQIQKLTAHYVANGGMAADDAAKRAYENVLGFKYDFVDTYRIPSKQHETPAGVPSSTIAAGAWHARQLIKDGKFAIAPAYDDRGGLSKNYLTGETERTYGRDGVWVTAPGEGGLALTYKGEPVALRDGKPLVLTWKDLEEIASVSPLAPRKPGQVPETRRLLMDKAREALAP